MSRVQSQVCEGCWRQCRYADFHPLKDLSYQDMKACLKRQVEGGLRTGSRAHITRATVLGKLHEMKMKEWGDYQNNCPHWGQKEPESIEDFLEWAATLHAVTVRVALGMPKRKARNLKSALKVKELAVFYKLWKPDSKEVPF